MSEQLFGALGQRLGSAAGQSAMSGAMGQGVANTINQIPLLTGTPTTIANPSAPGVTTTVPAQSGGAFGGSVTPQQIGTNVGGALGGFLGQSVGSRLERLRDAELGQQAPLPIAPVPPVIPTGGIPPSLPNPNALVVPGMPLTLADLLRRR